MSAGSRSQARTPAATKRLTLLACILGSGVVFVDATIVTVALPEIERDLGGGLSTQQWVVNAYALVLASLLLVGGSLGDIYGEKEIFGLGVGGFGATSLLCAIAPSAEFLIAGRALQGLFGAMLIPATLAVITAVFPEGERGGAVGSWTAWTGIAGVIGPFAGGVLVDSASWRWIFAVNVPLVLLTLAVIALVVPGRVSGERRGHVDLIGALLCAIGLAGPVYALIEQPARGWGDPLVFIPLIGGVLVFAGFLLYERRAREPMLDLSLFRRRNFSAGNLTTLLFYAGLSVVFFFLVLFLQEVGGYSALASGLAIAPMTLVMFVLSKRFGMLADRFGPRFFMTAGPLVGAVGLLLMLRLDGSISYLTDVLPAVLVFALGLSMTVAPLTATILAGVDQLHAGLASGVNNAVSRVAALLGIAAIGAALATSYAASVDDAIAERPLSAPAQSALERSSPLARVEAPVGVPEEEVQAVVQAAQDASISAFRGGMVIAAVLLALGGLVALFGIRNPRRAVAAADCPGGAICGASADAARPEARRAPVQPGPAPTPAPAGGGAAA